ncbi:MAG: topA [Actinomycetia bacterium]|jgi:DNA topoisomerase-1|nr:topA [Actinomycetes bacterium]
MGTTMLADLRECRLSWSDDAQPGLHRRRVGRGFTYVGPDGRVERDPAVRARVKALAIPPAWADVWICASPNGHLQATGRDARGRKQYRYHPRFREHCELTKFDHLAVFGRVLPRIRARVADDIARPGLPREKVVATVVRLLEATLVRVGNEEYAKQNGAFGLTTLRNRHARLDRGAVRFVFRGKSGRDHEVSVTDASLCRIIRKCQDLPGQLLFQYVEDGEPRPVSSTDVNDYLRETTEHEDVTAKEFRTWMATVISASSLASLPEPSSDREARRAVTETIGFVSRHLGNTPAVCRRSYVHPTVIDAFHSGVLAEQWTAPVPRVRGLVVDERRLLALLDRGQSSAARNAA